ncbi:hypothetical protein EYF80_008895 [Liparis tanakae]|uniref:Uncharacterized protein n=1 Tax=Liparis tanakae TaxID=230148 RepID=A0A4Z2ISB6_9TELE|nr:hypothetical protein EYF80_008895 [Liparis tanakae]
MELTGDSRRGLLDDEEQRREKVMDARVERERERERAGGEETVGGLEEDKNAEASQSSGCSVPTWLHDEQRGSWLAASGFPPEPKQHPAGRAATSSERTD